jgi:glc operon protein GlcG
MRNPRPHTVEVARVQRGELMASYGTPITTELAKKVAAAALAEARANGWTMAAAIVDPAGILVYFEKIDDTQHASPRIAIDKARSAAMFKRPTKAFQDSVEKGGVFLRVMGLRGASFVEGGVPIVVSDTIIGGLGVSGGLSEQDGQCCRAALEAIK